MATSGQGSRLVDRRRRHHLLEQPERPENIVAPSLGGQLEPGVRGDVIGRHARDDAERHGAEHGHCVGQALLRCQMEPVLRQRRIMGDTLLAQVREAEAILPDWIATFGGQLPPLRGTGEAVGPAAVTRHAYVALRRWIAVLGVGQDQGKRGVAVNHGIVTARPRAPVRP